MSNVVPDLIYDVGLFDGDDTAYYLHQGYRVVSIDANPNMIEQARQRFSKELRAGQLKLLNYAISMENGVARFNVSEVPEWSSFNTAIASRNGTAFVEVEVPTARFDWLLEQHGVPQYLKIDIEGNDWLCLRGLRQGLLPRYVSAESECDGDAATLSDEKAIEILELLHKAGYQRYKLIRQTDFGAVRSSSLAHLAQRVAGSMTHGRLRVPVLEKLAAPFSDRARIEKIGYEFKSGTSGPWGEDTPGNWMDYPTARRIYLEGRRAYFSRPDRPPAFSYWFDWHATY